MHRIYLYVGPKTASEKSQNALLREHGLDPETAFIDYAPDRTVRDDMLRCGLRSGTALHLTTPAALGNGHADVFKTVLALGEMNVSVHVIGEDGPELYDTTEKAAAFAKRAVTASRRQNAVETAKASDVGRPRKWVPAAADIVKLRPKWHDKNISMSIILEYAEELARENPDDPDRGITRQDLHRILGPRTVQNAAAE